MATTLWPIHWNAERAGRLMIWALLVGKSQITAKRSLAEPRIALHRLAKCRAVELLSANLRFALHRNAIARPQRLMGAFTYLSE